MRTTNCRFLFPWILAASLAAQSEPAADGVSLDGEPLLAPKATYDPRGMVEVSASSAGVERGWRLRVPMLGELSPGPCAVGDDPGLVVRERRGDEWELLTSGKADIVACSRSRVEGTLWYGGEAGDDHVLRFALTPEIAQVEPAVVRGAREVAPFPPPVDRPSNEDLVFAAVGNTGTGLPGAERMAEQIAKLAPSGPLDFVLLLGDTFLPAGVESATDRRWTTNFEDLFGSQHLRVPFYAVAGDADRVSLPHLVEYGKFNLRWTMPAFTYDFEVESHGAKFLFVALDTEAVTGDISDGVNRTAMRLPWHKLASSNADWKIVFGHGAMYTGGPLRRGQVPKLMRERLAKAFAETDVDVYINADNRVMEVVSPKGTTLHVTAGGGGGPEMADSLVWGANTRCAFTGGGFAWFRFDGESLEVSLRDADGAVRCVHSLRKS